MTDNRTTELREKLAERGIKWKSEFEDYGEQTIWQTPNGAWCYYSDNFSRIAEPSLVIHGITPEQAIAATLGSPRESELLRAIDDVLRNADDTVWVCDGETLVDRMVAIGAYGHEVYEGAEPWGRRDAQAAVPRERVVFVEMERDDATVTLGSEREKRLEKLARSLYADYYSEWPDRAEEAYAEWMKELGIGVIGE